MLALARETLRAASDLHQQKGEMPSAEKSRAKQTRHGWNKAVRALRSSSARPEGSPVGLMQSEHCKHVRDLVENGYFLLSFFFFNWMHLEIRLESTILSISPFFSSGSFFLRHCTQADNPKETSISMCSSHAAAVKPSPLGLLWSLC